MPHEVIMPALGMAQDSGLLVAWHKSPGERVASSDVLMEVETDKSTMEVEAGHDGYVAELRAEAGAEVPVGQVIAVISDSPDGAATPPRPAAKAPVPEAAAPAAPAEGREVVMPALGMAQETGLLVAWRKQPGDAVAASDILMEVETDKSTMEVEAGHDGYLAEVRAAAGAEVPVGSVVAVITREKPAAPRQATPAAAPEPAPAQPPAAGEPAAPARPSVPPAESGRILASPKARRLARERGLDLARLAAAGHPQPFHVADLDVLAALPAPAEAAATAPAASQLQATVPAGVFADFRAWLDAETGGAIPATALWAAFAAASLRAATAAAGPLAVRVEIAGPAPADATYLDPDRQRLSALAPADDPPAPDLTLRDLTATRITALRLPGPAPALTVARGAEPGTLALTLDFAEPALAPAAAVALLDGLAARLETPLRQLL